MIFLPQPSSLSYGEGTFTIHYDSRIFLDSESPAELFSAAQLLQQEIETQTGFRPAICRRHQPVGSHLIYLTASPELSREAYTLAVTPENITICGSLESGVLYGVQTLRQMIRQPGAVLPTILISDKPAMENRGFYHDATRGRVPTLSYLKQLADTLSFYKINQLQLYIEHSYLFDDLTEMWRDDTPLTAEDILELDRYCKGLGIDLVPSLARNRMHICANWKALLRLRSPSMTARRTIRSISQTRRASPLPNTFFPNICSSSPRSISISARMKRLTLEKGLPAHSPRKREPPSSTPSL